MVVQVGAACRLAACIMACIMPVLAGIAYAAEPQISSHATERQTSSPALIARCSHLYDLWFRYDQDPVFWGAAQKSYAELALYNCQQGKYEEGIPVLEQLLRNSDFDLSHVERGWK